ncbi:MAG: tetratricopeptide repeat protein [Bacteroidetes bacterium]|nr:tetratricopeptide repeat protein [Bacteroidota bacterium]
MKRCFTIFWLFCSAIFFGQEGTTHLIKVEKKNTKDTVQVNALLDLGIYYQGVNPDSALYYHEQAKKLSMELKDQVLTIKVYNELIWDYYIKSEYDRSIAIYTEAESLINKTLKDRAYKKQTVTIKKLKASCLTNVASVYNEKGDYMDALTNYFSAITVCQEINNKQALAANFANIANVYSRQGDMSKSLTYNYKALKIFESMGNKIYEAGALGNIGLNYSRQGNYKKALEYHLKSYKINITINNLSGQATNLENLGSEYGNLNNRNLALEYFLKALKLHEQLGNIFGKAQCYGNLGITYHLHGDSVSEHNPDKKQSQPFYDTALDYYLNALKINTEIGSKQGQAFNITSIGGLYISTGNYLLSEKFLKQAYALAKEIGSLNDLQEVCLDFFKLYNKQGKSRQALNYYKLYIHYRDSIRSEENIKASLQQEIKFAYEKKATADSVKVAEERKISSAQLSANKTKIREEKNLRSGLYAGLLLVIFFALITANRFKIISRQKKLIEIQKMQLEYQKGLVEEKQKEVLDSIHYAKRIQTAMLTSEKYMERVINNLTEKNKDLLS